MCFAIVSFTPPQEEYYGMLMEMDARRRGSSGGWGSGSRSKELDFTLRES